MTGIILLTVAVTLMLGSVEARDIAVQNFGPGYVILAVYDKVKEAQVNLIAGSKVSLHVVYRNDKVVVNSKNGNLWNTEMAPSNFHIGQAVNKITTVIEAKSSGYDVFMNGQHYYYQGPTNSVRAVKQVNYISTGHFFEQSAGKVSRPPLQLSVGKVLNDYSIGKVIYIKATAPSSGNFEIDLFPTLPAEMTEKWKKSVLVIYALMSSDPKVLLNTYGPKCDGTGQEETSGSMPFRAGESFEMIIVAQQFGFEIGVNGEHFASYDYRLPLPHHGTVMLINVPAIEKIEYY